jgi:hypothetical protein
VPKQVKIIRADKECIIYEVKLTEDFRHSIPLSVRHHIPKSRKVRVQITPVEEKK